MALALRERDAPVVVLDAGDSAAGRPGSATSAAGGMLAAQYETPRVGSLGSFLAQARARHHQFAADVKRLSGADVGLRSEGMLVANLDPAQTAAARETVRWQQSAGLAAELLDGSRAASLQADLPAEAESWLWLPEEARLDAQSLSAALWLALERAGAVLRTGAPAQALESDGSRVRGVRLADGSSLEAETVVVALGAWSAQLDGLPAPLPVRPVRGQVLHIRSPRSSRQGPLVADHGGRYVIPRADGSVLLGSTMEETGFEAFPGDPATDRQALLESAGWLWPPCRDGEVLGHWAGLRPLSADGLPILGPDPILAGLHYAAGYGRSGILLAPLAGDIVADLILDGSAGQIPDWGPYRVDRFREATPYPES